MDRLKLIYIQSHKTRPFSPNIRQLEILCQYYKIEFSSTDDKGSLNHDLGFHYNLILIDQFAFDNSGFDKCFELQEKVPSCQLILIVQNRLRDEQRLKLTKEGIDYYTSPLLAPNLITKFEGYADA